MSTSNAISDAHTDPGARATDIAAAAAAPVPRRPAALVPMSVIAITFVSIALLLVNASLLIINTAGTMDSSEQYARSYEIKRSLTAFQSTVATAESGQRGYLLTGQSAYLEPFLRATRGWRAEIERLRELASTNGGTEQTPRLKDLDALEAMTASAVSRLEQTIAQTGQPGPSGDADVAGTDWATAGMDQVRGLIDRMMQDEDTRIEALRGEVLHDMWLTVGIAVFTTVLTVGVLIGLQALLRRYGAARARAEGALLEANQRLNREVEERTAELTELSQHLIRVAEEEKARLARELHDTLGSNLTAINMDLNWISKRLASENVELRERLQRSLQMLSDTVELKHEVIEGLRPSHLDNLGLAYAMRSHCREFTRRTGVPCDVDVLEDFDDLDPSWSIALYRIAQEALTNVTRHAKAQSVRVQLVREEEGIRLRVIDDGMGIPEGAATRPKSHGLVGMRERMRQIGGAVRFSPSTGQRGTVVDAFIPHAAPVGQR
ncbi:signal transduction histidine kinase [Povalibacter uvarum]|uniref:histidine kinase n=1 Tax=Povalibacter uvarum TaxID=732238 RepID=A0A841HNN6_9GAMM|nr:CHASE3 domain-containing protein [Povalibacter uvarum]MBB6094486.1 signal transduction histidine kinase [Povalibacter uvarum]